MRCDNTYIKDLLPEYAEERLPAADRERVSLHLSECADCRTELALLRAMAEERVPDPGEAFWTALPDRIHREIERREERKRPRDLAGPFRRFLFPRWAWVTAAAGVLLAAIAWSVLRPPQPQMAGTQLPDTGGIYVDVLATDRVTISELTTPELDSLDAWASTELASLQEGVVDMFMNAPEGAIEERLADMDTQELEQLSSMLDADNEEG